MKDLKYMTLLAKGYLGDTISINFIEYIRKNYKVFNAEDILNKFDRDKAMEKDFKDMVVTEITFYSKELVKYIKKQKKLTPKQSANLLLFVKMIPKEAASGFWSQFAQECRDVATKWYKETQGAQDYIYGFLAKKEALK